jgi:uncharacterized SAM-binding protein YcdF (DUF218 family)
MNTEQKVEQAVLVIWDYLQMHQPLKICDAIFLLGNRDERTAKYAAELFLEGYGEWLVISGGNANKFWGEMSEAEHFAQIAMQMGVPKEKLILEDKAISTGENVTLTYTLLQKLQLKFNSMLIVQKPYMERRAYATLKKQWPDSNTEFYITSPPIPFEDYYGYDEANSKDNIINLMVGYVQRIKEYPKLGFQIEQPMPDAVWRAWEFLVGQGYTKDLMAATH